LQKDGYFLDQGKAMPCPSGRICSGPVCDSIEKCDECNPSAGIFQELTFNSSTHTLLPSRGTSCSLRQENCLSQDYVERRNSYGILTQAALACSQCEDRTVAFHLVLGAVTANCTYPQALSAQDERLRQAYLWTFSALLGALAIGLGLGIYFRERARKGVDGAGDIY